MKRMDMQIRIRMPIHTKMSWIRYTPDIKHITIFIHVCIKTYVDIHTFQPCRTSQLQKQHLPEENPEHQGRGTSASDVQIQKGCLHLHYSPGPHGHYEWNKVSYYAYIRSEEYEDKADIKFIILRYIFQENIFIFILYFNTFICFKLK
jgi:hypothetical protein